jgi:hypothetical protein
MSTCLNFFLHNLKLCSHYVQKKQKKQGSQIESDIKMPHFHSAASNQYVSKAKSNWKLADAVHMAENSVPLI